MDIWFIRANGETAHNRPDSKLFVPGEPPNYPHRAFNYRLECLRGGFARVGWPASGDLRTADWGSTARRAYGSSLPPHWLKNLQRFSEIRIGHLIVMPADRERYDVHLGLVVANHLNEPARPESAPYRYHYNISAGDWYENAHRVPVHWHRESGGNWAVLSVPGLGGVWLKGFGRVSQASDAIVKAAKQAGLRIAV